ncbi:hypothetical protein AYO21_05552 [Fonsecaea monophora]|uniref:RING-type domain-containing protein n=1 Tax=Fonsecaea monophora TaxID=254056 RepID=A0A177FAL3_9EURO|nr:hypothetical protein AYO21_05552 [Fonsecaea monophora]OAG40269.1 hypothetical protein AYO21_05552 [Fonsecaea monophora]
MSQKVTEASSNEERLPDETWEAFKDVDFNRRPGNDWTVQNIPPELQGVEDDSNLPEKLKQILAWSLFPDLPPPPPSNDRQTVQRTEGFNVRDSVHVQDDDNPHQTIAESNGRSVASEGFDNDDTSESRSTQSERRSERGRLRARYLGGGVLGSTLGLLTTLKGKADRESLQASASAKTLSKSATQVECTSCFEDASEHETRKLPCNHSYCKSCLTTLITTALQNESSFPPKCCLTEIPLQTVLLSLDAKHRELYKEKAAEYSVAAQERWYCPNTKCLKWIPPSKLQRIRRLNMRCPHCATKICSICRGLAHRDSADCPQDFGLEATMVLAELQGWRRCFKCRTMVEWRSCACTEADENNRQEELRRLRNERAEIADAEAAEINRIIAQVEEVERLQAEERRREEQRQQEEWRREEAELARLEEQRLQEEADRRAEEERMAQELRRILKLSVEETCDKIQSAWNGILQTQKKTLDNRHLNAEQQYMLLRDEAWARQQEGNSEILAKMESNISKRTTSVKERHDMEMRTFDTEQQELEDDMFLEIKLHLRGKQDKEARERRLQERFQRQREEKQQEMLSKHQSELDALQMNATMELQGLTLSNESKLARLEHKSRVDFELSLLNVAADRAWFGFLAERRQNMVDENRRLMLEALNADQEPVGLTEETAATVGPYLVNVQRTACGVDSSPRLDSAPPQESRQEPWKEVLSPSPASSASPARSLFELAATSQQLLNSLDVSATTPEPNDEKPQPGAVAHLTANTAFAWMTGDNAPESAHSATAPRSPPSRSHGLYRQPRTHAAPMRFAATSDLVPMAMSGALRQRATSAPPKDHAEVPASIPTPLQAGRRRLQAHSEGWDAPEHYVNTRPPTPPVPKVPLIYLDQQSSTRAGLGESSSTSTMQQPRVLGGLVPTNTTNKDSRHSGHRRQVSSSSSSTSAASSLLAASIAATSRSSSSSPSTRATSIRSSGDSLFLHSLITSTTNAATAAGRPSTSSLSPVSPISPSGENDRTTKQKPSSRSMSSPRHGQGPRRRPARSVWSILS